MRSHPANARRTYIRYSNQIKLGNCYKMQGSYKVEVRTQKLEHRHQVKKLRALHLTRRVQGAIRLTPLAPGPTVVQHVQPGIFPPSTTAFFLSPCPPCFTGCPALPAVRVRVLLLLLLCLVTRLQVASAVVVDIVCTGGR